MLLTNTNCFWSEVKVIVVGTAKEGPATFIGIDGFGVMFWEPGVKFIAEAAAAILDGEVDDEDDEVAEEVVEDEEVVEEDEEEEDEDDDELVFDAVVIELFAMRSLTCIEA